MSFRWVLAILLFLNGVAYFWFSGSTDASATMPASDKSRVDLPPAIKLLADADADPALGLVQQDKSNKDAIRSCMVIGPIESEGVSDNLQAGLEVIGVASSGWESKELRRIGFWVYLPPTESRQAAQQLLSEVHAKGLDSFVFEQGELANGVSFGLFSNQQNAGRRRQELISLGYDAAISVATRELTHWWLQAPVESRSLLADKFWSDLKKMVPEAKISEKSCEAVASFLDFP